MSIDLRELEEFIRYADETAALQPAWVRPRLARGRRMAELVLRLAGSVGTEEDRLELAALMAGESPKPWSWVKPGPGEDYQQWTDDRFTAERHRRQNDVAEKAIRGWIAAPAVVSEVEAAKPALSALVEPLALLDQRIVTLVAARFLAGAGLYPDGSEWPNPFDTAPHDVVELAAGIQPPFVAQLQALAGRIAAAGVPLDPNDPAVLLVFAQLALLDVDLARPAAEIVAGLNIWPPGSINREAAAAGQVVTWASRHGHNARFLADLAASAQALADRLGPPAIRPPYAGGQMRSKPAREYRVEGRRAAVVEVLRRFPDANAGALHRTWANGPATPGGLLRNKLGLHPHDAPPSETTLRKDLDEIG